MSVNSKMTAIADEIRAKTGQTGTLDLDAMAEAIASLDGDNKTISNISVTVIAPDGNMLGDVNGDGHVTMADVILISMYLGGQTETISAAGDVDGDGIVTDDDLAIIQQFIGVATFGQAIARVTITYNDNTVDQKYCLVTLDVSGESE